MWHCHSGGTYDQDGDSSVTAAGLEILLNLPGGYQWYLWPLDNVIVMGAARNLPFAKPNLLSLFLAGPTSDWSHEFQFPCDLIDTGISGMIVVWTTGADIQLMDAGAVGEEESQPWLLIRNDKLGELVSMLAPSS